MLSSSSFADFALVREQDEKYVNIPTPLQVQTRVGILNWIEKLILLCHASHTKKIPIPLDMIKEYFPRMVVWDCRDTDWQRGMNLNVSHAFRFARPLLFFEQRETDKKHRRPSVLRERYPEQFQQFSERILQNKPGKAKMGTNEDWRECVNGRYTMYKLQKPLLKNLKVHRAHFSLHRAKRYEDLPCTCGWRHYFLGDKSVLKIINPLRDE